MTDGAPKTFEEKLDRIDAIVKELEGGRVELDRAIELFREGKVLAAECETMLRGAQEQVERTMNGST
jgi:exodeoxyribonuclease VII small subunit